MGAPATDHRWIASLLDAQAAELGAATNTLLAYGRDLKDFAEWLAGRGSSFAEAGRETVEAYLVSLDAQGLAKSTRARRLSAIRQLYRFAFEEGWRADNPAIQIKGPGRDQKLPKTLEVIEVDRLLEAARHSGRTESDRLRNSCLMELLYATGMRVTELVSLPVAAARGDPRMLLVSGKGGKERMVPLGEPAQDAVRDYMLVRERFLGAGYEPIGMDHFAKPDDELAIAQRNGQLHRNFQGYTTHADCDLVAMGVSAISQIGSVYYQNEHDMAAYGKAVDGHQTAIRRGVCLTQDDIIRRAVITQLICHFELDFSTIEQQFGLDFKQYFAQEQIELQQFAADDLISLSENGIRVTNRGRLLIRRICMAFDAYIPKQQPTQGFSRII